MNAQEPLDSPPKRFPISMGFYCFILLLILFLKFSITLYFDRGHGRVRADMRSLSTAIETYFLDHGVYPVSGEFETVPSSITTPVSYSASLPKDIYKMYGNSENSGGSLYNFGLFIFFIFVGLFSILAVVAIRKKRPWNVADYFSTFASPTVLGFLLFNSPELIEKESREITVPPGIYENKGFN